MDTSNLWKAGFFNYLREDITFSLMNRRTLKIDLANMQIPDKAVDDEDQLNIAALYLAEAINFRFDPEAIPSAGKILLDRFDGWRISLPEQFKPFYDSSGGVITPGVFPTIRLLRDCHVAVAQYCHVTRSLLHGCTESDWSQEGLQSVQNGEAVRLCGLAFTSNSPAVLVNSFGPISYCGRHIQGQALQIDLIRRLYSCGKETGWPVQRMIEGLQHYWSTEDFGFHGDTPPLETLARAHGT